jgi:hypothetical protein
VIQGRGLGRCDSCERERGKGEGGERGNDNKTMRQWKERRRD